MTINDITEYHLYHKFIDDEVFAGNLNHAQAHYLLTQAFYVFELQIVEELAEYYQNIVDKLRRNEITPRQAQLMSDKAQRYYYLPDNYPHGRMNEQ